MILPGVQVLFAFLLVVPFNQRFADIRTFQKPLLRDPPVRGGCLRVSDRSLTERRDQVPAAGQGALVAGGQLAQIMGGVLLAIAMTGAIWLVSGLPVRLDITAVAAVSCRTFAVLWYAIPLRRLREHRNGS